MTPSQILDMLESKGSFDYFCQTYFQQAAPAITPGSINKVSIEDSLLRVLWEAIFNRNRVYLVVSDSAVKRRLRAEQFKLLLAKLPPETYGTMVKKINVDRIEFDNGCRIVFASGQNAGRGHAISILVVDGPLEDLKDQIYALYPCVASTGGTILQS